MIDITVKLSLGHSANPPTPSFATPSSPTNPDAPSLPLTCDPLLAQGSPANPIMKRHLGEAFDQRLEVSSTNFACTVDSKHIFAGGYTDYSFRVIGTENGFDFSFDYYYCII